MNKNFIVLLFIVGSFFGFFSCASQQEMVKSPETKNVSRQTETSFLENNSVSERNIPKETISSELPFLFALPDSGWLFLSDTNLLTNPIEFYNKTKGLRAEIRMEENASALTDLARSEMLKFQGEGNILTTKNYASKKFETDGEFFELFSEKNNSGFSVNGFIFQKDSKKIFLTLSSDSLWNQKDFQNIFDLTFIHFKLKNKTDTQDSELSENFIQEYTNEKLGYTFRTEDTLWHFWNAVAKTNSDPDIVLSDKEQEVSLFIYSTYIPEDEISESMLFKTFLSRLNLTDENAEIDSKKKNAVTEFSATKQIENFDFEYKGKMIYDSGKAVFIACWTQGILAKKYKTLIDNAINGLTLKEKEIQAEDFNKFNAVLFNEIGLMKLQNKEHLIALSYFERANRLDNTEPLYLINCGFVYQLKELYGPGISHFLSQLDLVETNAKLLSVLAEMYEEIYDYGNERKYIEMALQLTPNEPEYIINLSDALWGIGQRTASLEVVQNLYDKQPSSRLGVYVAKTYMGLDKYAEAVELLYETKESFGLTKELAVTLIEALLFLERYNEAVLIAKEALKTNPDDLKLLTLSGKTYFYLKNYKEAERLLSKALKLEKDNEDAKSFLSATKAFLGKADNKILKSEIQPVEEAKNLNLLKNKDASLKAKEENFPAVVHFRREALKAHRNKPWVSTEEMLVEILDERGISLFQEFTYSFLPGYDRIYMNKLEVYDSDLKLKKKIPLTGTYITYATEKGNKNEFQVAHFPVHELKKGDFIHLQISRTGIDKNIYIPFLEYKSSMEVPVAKSSFRIYADTSTFVTEEYGPLEKEIFKDGADWSIEYPIVIRKEIYMPEYREYGAGFLLSAKRKWNDVGNDYENLIQHQYKNAISVREKAFEVRGNKIGREALLAMIHFVRDNIRYRDVKFGGHSLIPQTAEQTLKDKKGDCKDQALLLKEMLETIGIKSYLTAIPLHGTGYANLATIQQFDHMILYIPKTESTPEMWVDPTDKTGNDRPIPLDMEGKTAFIIDGKNSRIQTTPVLEDYEEHKAAFFHRLHIAGNGNAEFKDSVVLEGKFAASVRNMFYSKDSKEQEQLMEGLLKQYIPDARLFKIETKNLNDFEKPFILVASFGSKNFFGLSKDGMKGNFPNIWEASILKLPKVNKRFLPIRIPHEAIFEVHFDISTDNGKSSRIVLPKVTKEKPEYTAFSILEDGILFTTFALYADPSEYEKIRKEWNFLLNQTSPTIIVQ